MPYPDGAHLQQPDPPLRDEQFEQQLKKIGDDIRYYKITIGTMQGDAHSPDEFQQLYQQPVDDWQETLNREEPEQFVTGEFARRFGYGSDHDQDRDRERRRIERL